MNHRKYRYNHIGMPTTKKLKNEEYLPEYDVYHSGYQENEFNVEWMRYGKKCRLPDIVKKLPHIAFEVDDIYKAIKGHKVIIKPNSPCNGIMVAFVLVNDVPIEFIQFGILKKSVKKARQKNSRKEKSHKKSTKKVGKERKLAQ